MANIRSSPAYRTVACTTTTTSDLSRALVTGRSYLRHHRDHQFVVVLVDRLGHAPELDGRLRVVGGDWLDLDSDEYGLMAARFSAVELAIALRPLVLRQVLARADVAVYLDPDVYVVGQMSDHTDLAVEHSMVLTPTMRVPLPHDGREPGPGFQTPLFYPGFVSAGPSATPFLTEWQAELARRPLAAGGSAPAWFDQIPQIAPHLVVSSPQLAVAHWNLHERPIDADTGFVALSGYRPDTPWLLSAECAARPRHLLSERADVADVLTRYRAELAESTRGQSGQPGYAFDSAYDGSPFSTVMRRTYRTAWDAAGARGADSAGAGDLPSQHPFGPGLPQFQDWLATPANILEAVAGLNRFLIALWEERPDLRQKFPAPLGADAPRFRRWCLSERATESVPSWAHPRRVEKPRLPESRFGVNIGGFLTAEIGLGELGRIVHRAVEHADVPICAVVEERSLLCRTSLPAPPTTGRPRFPVSILAANSDQAEILLTRHPELGHERYRIGLWTWELEQFPTYMRRGFAHVDEVWTISEFCRAAIAVDAPVPVKTFPVPVEVPALSHRCARRPADPVSFLFCFDFNSTGQRKNPWGVVHAFQAAFPDRSNAKLTIKATNGHLHPAAVERLLYAIGSDPRIHLLQAYLSVAELSALYSDSDAYVSLHRSEGFGLTVAEAMARAMPVVATNYSSTTEFFDSQVGWPVPCSTVPVGPGWAPYPADATWADPDLTAAAHALQVIAENPAEACRRGDAARQRIVDTRSIDVAASWVREQLQHAHAEWMKRATGDTASTGSDADGTARTSTSSSTSSATRRTTRGVVMERVVRRTRRASRGAP